MIGSEGKGVGWRLPQDATERERVLRRLLPRAQGKLRESERASGRVCKKGRVLVPPQYRHRITENGRWAAALVAGGEPVLRTISCSPCPRLAGSFPRRLSKLHNEIVPGSARGSQSNGQHEPVVLPTEGCPACRCSVVFVPGPHGLRTCLTAGQTARPVLDQLEERTNRIHELRQSCSIANMHLPAWRTSTRMQIGRRLVDWC